ncbi:thermonuclease family protein [Mycoplasma simbae]|uniref:thermonuclease family protein n=1 Tax=Mycoplasma simbae TaxID=36744 RepID=UPI00049531B6|nr:thermonuclease family protein [Mycoplasma simbae]
MKKINLILTPIVALPLSAVSCINFNDKQTKPKTSPGDQKPADTDTKKRDTEKFNATVSKYNLRLQTKLPYQISKTLTANKATLALIDNIFDGDTFSFSIEGGFQSYRSRFSGVDTPEKTVNSEHGRVPSQGQQHEYALKASAFTSELLDLPGIKVYVVPQKTKNGSSDITDRYDRIVSINYIVFDDKVINLNSELVRLGFARMHYISQNERSTYYTANDIWYYELASSSKEAKEQQRGIYSTQANIDQIYP